MIKPERIIKNFQKCKEDRSTWDNHWQDIAEFVLPTRNFFDYTRTKGSQRRGRIYNSTAPEAAVQLAAALEGMLFNTGIVYF